MACSGCDARRAWIKRKATLMAQTVAALVRQESKADPRTEQAVAIMAKDIAALPLSVTKDTDRGSK
jgi:hypothetical protein